MVPRSIISWTCGCSLSPNSKHTSPQSGQLRSCLGCWGQWMESNIWIHSVKNVSFNQKQTNKQTKQNKTNKQTNKHTNNNKTNTQTHKQQQNKQTNKQTNTHTNKQTNKQTNKHTNKQTNKHTNKQTNEPTNKQTNHVFEDHLDHIHVFQVKGCSKKELTQHLDLSETWSWCCWAPKNE